MINIFFLLWQFQNSVGCGGKFPYGTMSIRPSIVRTVTTQKIYNDLKIFRNHILWSLMKKFIFCIHVYIYFMVQLHHITVIGCCGLSAWVLQFHLFGQEFESHIRLFDKSLQTWARILLSPICPLTPSMGLQRGLVVKLMLTNANAVIQKFE